MTDSSLLAAAASTAFDTADLPPLSALYPTSTSSPTISTPSSSVSCGSCYDVFPLSMVGVVAWSSIDSIGSRASRNEAITTSIMTQEIGSMTVDTYGNATGAFSDVATEVIPSGNDYTLISGTSERYGSEYLSALSTIVVDYTLWQTVLDAGVCIETSQVVSLDPPATFLDGDLVRNSYLQIFGSAITARLPSASCATALSEISTTARSIPTFLAAIPTAIIEAGSQSEAQISTAAKIGFGVAFGLAICLILGFVAFLIWKRLRTQSKRTEEKPQRNQHQADSKSGRDSGRGREPLVLEASADLPKRQVEIDWRSHWRAPIFMLGGILAGIAFALGHNFLYAGLELRPVDDVSLSQAWVIRFGTLLAFLVKISFAVTVGTAFVQLQWLKLRQKPRSMKEIDVLSSILGNILSSFDRTWLHFRTLAVLATIFWLLPLLPVITPGTLNVQSLPQTTETSLVVPRFTPNNDTGSLNGPWGSWVAEIGGSFINFTPSFGLAQVYLPAAIGMQTLSMSPQYANQSFHLDFFGPAINCSGADENVVLTMTERYGIEAVAQLPVNTAYQIYYSWVGGDDTWLGNNDNPQNIDLVSTDAARLFVMVTVQSGPAPNVTINGTTYWTPKITECSLYNASYGVDIIHQNSEQTIETNITFVNNVPAIVPGSNGNRVQPASYTSLMAGLGSLLVGSISVDTMHQITGTIFQYGQAEHLGQVFVNGTSYNDQIAASLEEMFQNMTLSVLTSNRPYFTTNQTVIGNVTAYRTTYTYDPFGLFLAYGLALVFTLLCAAAGFYAFTINNGSYQNIFSTFIRTTKDANLTIEDQDTGRDPRPRDLSRATVKVTAGRPEIDAWLQNPAQRQLIVRKPVISTTPATYQQEELRQRNRPGSNGPAINVLIPQGQFDNTSAVLRRQQVRNAPSGNEPVSHEDGHLSPNRPHLRQPEGLSHSRTSHISPALRSA